MTPGDRLCIEIHSDWTLPMSDLPGIATYGPFAYPYTEGAKLARQAPPDDVTMRAQCDFFAINSFNREAFSKRREEVDPANATIWADFFRELRTRLAPVRFETARTQWLTRWIEIYHLKGGA